MRLAFLHTADIHVATFDALLDARAPDAARVHQVEAGWLAEARETGLTPVLATRLAAALDGFHGADAVLCTCSTLGPLVDAAAPATPAVRIDRPMLERAVAAGADILVAYCLESTRDPTLDLLTEIAAAAGRPIRPRTVLCAGAWAQFEAGDASALAGAIEAALAPEIDAARPDVLVLAQASMRVAEPRLSARVPTLSSPVPALERLLATAQLSITS